MARRRKKAAPEEVAHIAEGLRPLAVEVGLLVEDPANARLHGERNLAAVIGSLKLFGQQKPIVVRKENMQVVAGNGTLAAAKALGWSHVAANVEVMDAATAAAYAIADNRTAELATWDTDALSRTLDAIEADYPMGKLGFTEQEMADLLGDDEVEESTDADDRGMTPEEQLEQFEAAEVRQIVLTYSGKEYDWAVKQLDKIVTEYSLASFTDVVSGLLQGYHSTPRVPFIAPVDEE